MYKKNNFIKDHNLTKMNVTNGTENPLKANSIFCLHFISFLEHGLIILINK